jgi:predicted DNA-binding transcriptional regulator YafY
MIKKAKAGPKQPKAVIDYINHRGEQRPRTILPLTLRWGSTEWHPEPGWLLEAYDFEKQAQRSFACKDIIKWHDRSE